MPTIDRDMTARALQLAREGSGMTQREAARRLGIAPPSLNVYERGRLAPSPERIRDILRTLALGERQADEEPHLALAFELVGVRLLADAEGRVLCFADVTAAAHAVGVLEAHGLPGVGVIPFWSTYAGIPENRREVEATIEEPEDLARILAEALVAIADAAPSWLAGLRGRNG